MECAEHAMFLPLPPLLMTSIVRVCVGGCMCTVLVIYVLVY